MGQEASVEPEAPTLTSLSHQRAAITDKLVNMQGQLNLLTGMATQTHTKMVLQACQTAACEAYAIAGSRPSSGGPASMERVGLACCAVGLSQARSRSGR